MPHRTSGEPSPLSASFPSPDVEPAEKEFVELLERALVTDFGIAAVLERGDAERPARSVPVRGAGMRVIRPLVRTVSALTGHRQLEGCFSLFGYR